MLQPQPTSASGKRKFPASSFLTNKRLCHSPDSEDYEHITAFIIEWEDHDHNSYNFKQEISKVVHLFEKKLGVRECVRLKIPAYILHQHSSPVDWLMREITRMRPESSGQKVLELVYYAGHGGRNYDGSSLIAASRGRGGQEFDWNEFQTRTMSSADQDTVVFLDCCFAGLACQTREQGSKHMFSACDAEGTTAVPGPHSFTSFFTDACWTFGDEGFTLEQWAFATLKLARRRGGMEPVCESFGVAEYPIFFEPALWCERAEAENERQAEENANAMKWHRQVEITAIFREIVASGGMTDAELPTEEETADIEASRSLTQPFSQIGVYRAFRRMRDQQREQNLTGSEKNDQYYNTDSSGEESEDNDNESNDQESEDYNNESNDEKSEDYNNDSGNQDSGYYDNGFGNQEWQYKGGYSGNQESGHYGSGSSDPYPEGQY